MNGRERVPAALNGDETDKLCWAPLLDNYFTNSLPSQGFGQMNVPDETRKYITEILDQMPTFTKFILSTGDATAYGTPVDNLRAVSGIVNRYKWK